VALTNTELRSSAYRPNTTYTYGVTAPKPTGGSTSTTTSPASSYWQNATVPTYPTTPTALPGYMLASFNQQRRGVDMDWQNAIARLGRGRGRAEIGAGLQRDEARSGFNRASEDLMRDLGGKGTARFGFTAGRGLRRYAEDLSRRQGQIDFDLTTNINALMDAVEEARMARDRALGDIQSQEGIARSAAERYITTTGSPSNV